MKKVSTALFCIGSIMIAVSLPTSRGFVTVGVITLIVTAFLSLNDFHQMSFSLSWLSTPWKKKQAQAFLVLGIPFLFLLISGIYSQDLMPWIDDIRVECIGLILPFVALKVGKIPRKFIYLLQVLFIVACLVSSFYSLYVYWTHTSSINSSISQGQHMPTLIDPLPFSLMLSYSFILSIVLFTRNKTQSRIWEKLIYLALAIAFFFILHFLAVRSGIVCAYAGLLCFLLIKLRQGFKKRYLIYFFLFLLVPVIAYVLIPSFKSKVNYTLYDWNQIDTRKAGYYSDSNRLISYNLGIKMLLDAPLIGHGSGDIENMVDSYYMRYYPYVNKRIRPHNQFLSIAIESGLIGLVAFLFSLLFPLAQGRWKSDILFPIFTVQIILSCLVENTFDSSIGLTYYIFWTCIFLLQWKSKKENRVPASSFA